ncbi:5'-nucleotidase C-terminal domain-containing protein [Jeotgalibacillus sp. JSM ZJ347]|uniref:5'-nucleotidase C-terminal domain-containing protein n=1 Tax=Jeotgalibacillus sp. JSM ZJ347 TaxID=3342117 RepID=UPI0035A85B8B
MKKSYGKFATGAVTAAMVASVVAPVASADDHQFTDVSERYMEAVSFLVESGATNGVSDTQFGVSQSIKRVDAAVLLAKALKLDTEGAEDSGFTDVPARAVGAVNALKAAGVTNGKSETQFGSNDLVTRGEIAIWLANAFNLGGSGDAYFTDVNERYQDAVSALVEWDITAGINETQFGVNSQAKRGDYAILLHNAFFSSADWDLTLIHTNDIHSSLDEAPQRATVIQQQRMMQPNSLLVDAGDYLTGTLYWQQFQGSAELDFMNHMGYDAVTFGNHEFDNGSGVDGHRALQNFVTNAEFPFVGTNVDFSGDERFDGLQSRTITDEAEDGMIYDAVIKEVNGEKVGIFGLTTEETADISSPEAVIFEEYIERSQATVDALEDMGVNRIVALTHLGYNDSLDYDNDIELAEMVDGIDVIVGGHTHIALDEPIIVEEGDAPTLIVQTGGNGDTVGTLNVDFDEDGVIEMYAGQLIDVELYAPDAEAAAKLAPYAQGVEELKQQSTGVETVTELNGVRENVRTGETNLGNLITDGMLAKAKTVNPDTVIALQNGGGIRASIDAGDITVGEVLTVLPFGNNLVIMNLTGAEILETLEHSVKDAPNASGAFLHVAGMKFEYDSSQPAGERVVSAEVMVDGEYVALDVNESYFVATNKFTAEGGDGFEALEAAYNDNRVSEPGFADYELFIEYLESLGEVNYATEGRITDVNAE